MGERLGIEVFDCGDFVLEGGSIDVNGEGALITTESCLLNPNRNPDLNRAEIETRLRDWLGVKTIIWLGDGIEGDDTDGHVDDLTRFVAPNTVVTVVEEDENDSNYDPLQANLERLRAVTLRKDEPLEIRVLPMPSKIVRDGQRLPASYANFYIANEVVLLPVFGGMQRRVGRVGAQGAVPEPERGPHRLPGADLGPRRLPLPHPAAAAGLDFRRWSSF